MPKDRPAARLPRPWVQRIGLNDAGGLDSRSQSEYIGSTMKQTMLWISVLFLNSASPAFTQNAFLGQNFFAVDPGNLYRSAQLSPKQLSDRIDQLHIRTVLNLRGASSQTWYQEERRMTQAKGVEQIDIALSARRIPSREQLLKMLRAFDSAPRPILVHCLAGADRTGLASVIYRYDYQHHSLKDALKMLSLRFFHSDWTTPAQRYFFQEIYKGRQWAFDQYEPCQHVEYSYYDRRHCQP